MSGRLGPVLTIVLSIAVVVAFAAVAMHRPPPTPVGEEFNGWVGRVAPPFTLKTPDGTTVSLTQHKNEIVVLDFWATHCPLCVDEMPTVAAVAKQFAGRGVAYYAVNVGEAPAVVQAYLDASKLSLPVLMDPEFKASLAYDAEYLPLLVVINGDGRIASYEQGATDDLEAALTRRIESALQSGQAK